MASESADDRPSAASAWLVLLARALGLERAVLLLADRTGDPYRPVASYGPEPPVALLFGTELGDGRWSAAVPIDAADGPTGLLLLARPDAAPLPPADRELVHGLVDGAATLLERRRLQDDLSATRALLAQADRLSALGTLAAGIAHEIRNPLVSVRTFIQLLPERLHDEEFRNGFRELALGEIERICALINDLLAFSRPSPASRVPVDLSALAAQTVRLLDAEARKRGVVLQPRLTEPMPPVAADEAQVKQVLMNVVLNAIQATPGRGAVEVTTSADEGALVEVADRGPGIPADKLAQIFDPFFTTKETGSGLGLFVAHRIVVDHGGSITASARPGGGTVFAIRLPEDRGARGVG